MIVLAKHKLSENKINYNYRKSYNKKKKCSRCENVIRNIDRRRYYCSLLEESVTDTFWCDNGIENNKPVRKSIV